MRRVMVLVLVLAAVAGAWQWSRHDRARLTHVRFSPIETVAAATDTPPGGKPLPMGASKSYWLKTCDERLGPMHVTVRTNETPLAFTNDRSVDQLTAEAPPYDRASRVLGKTYATLAAQFAVTTRYIALPTQPPTTCLRPSVDVVLILSDFRVTVAREFAPGSCAYEAIRAHEMRHVAVNRAVLPRAAELIRQEIQREYGGRLYFGDPDRMAAELEAALSRHWLPRARSLIELGLQAHEQIDTPQEQDRMSRVCNGDVQAVLQQLSRS
ncbi:hypothetical protein Q3O98_15020 [Ralstonia pseudosolanacearum]|uniref:hypothetical protein n=1 Tax=Ralstonia pseudosolanacearum TaxID=1310165 RepID=UPI000B3B5450|nr:hypothetical protein [Ralstonia pseudosolanacearum]ARU22116.1 Bmp family protein [Ralstonia solanacearum]AXV74282.1 hypothetical protein CJO75_14780 [Ralstonia solanacearum]AXW72291.1 hypothetical protein CJO96_14815 [Ralstonia solanacearum]MDO3622398.1 hypothetical protein [Ralstonia pseudosolanacearum]